MRQGEITVMQRGRLSLLHVMLILSAVVVLLPVAWAVSASFKNAGDIFDYPPNLLPLRPTTANYYELFNGQPVARWLFNSLWIAAAATVVGSIISALGGFALAKYVFVGRDFAVRIIVAAMVVPFITLLVPLYVLISKLGLVDTYAGVILPQIVQPFGVFLMRQYIVQAIPDEIIDSARVDGASELRVFRSIVLPMMRPGLAVLGIWIFLTSFNTFLWPLMVLNSSTKQTLPVGLAALSAGHQVQYGTVMAGVVTAFVPPLLVFIGLQRQFIQGLTAGALAN